MILLGFTKQPMSRHVTSCDATSVFHRYKKTSVFSDAWMSRFSSLVEDAYLSEIAEIETFIDKISKGYDSQLEDTRCLKKNTIFQRTKIQTIFLHSAPKKKRFQCPPHHLCHSRRRRSRQHDHPVTIEEDSMNSWFDSKCFEDFFQKILGLQDGMCSSSAR